MDLVGLLINLVSGLVGSNIVGAAWKDKSLGVIGNSIAGLIGGAILTVIAGIIKKSMAK